MTPSCNPASNQSAATAGEVVFLTGANGSGRSTLAAALAGLLPRHGTVSVAGRVVAPCTPAGAVRAGDWKLVEFFEDGRRELYNLKDDPGQKHNLATTMPEKAAELHAKLIAWRKDVGAKMPTPNRK